MRPTIVFSAALFALTAFAVPAHAGPKSPKPWLKQKVEEAHQLAIKKLPKEEQRTAWNEKAKVLINEMLDWDEMTQRSLGRQWEKLDAKQQKEFSGVLREMIEASYRSKLNMASSGDIKKKPKKVDIEWLEDEIDGNTANVSARVTVDKQVAVLEFMCINKGDRWLVYDIAIDDVSTVRTYRSQFRKLIEKEGFDELLSRMKKKIADIREGRAQLGP